MRSLRTLRTMCSTICAEERSASVRSRRRRRRSARSFAVAAGEPAHSPFALPAAPTNATHWILSRFVFVGTLGTTARSRRARKNAATYHFYNSVFLIGNTGGVGVFVGAAVAEASGVGVGPRTDPPLRRLVKLICRNNAQRMRRSPSLVRRRRAAAGRSRRSRIPLPTYRAIDALDELQGMPKVSHLRTGRLRRKVGQKIGQ